MKNDELGQRLNTLEENQKGLIASLKNIERTLAIMTKYVIPFEERIKIHISKLGISIGGKQFESIMRNIEKNKFENLMDINSVILFQLSTYPIYSYYKDGKCSPINSTNYSITFNNESLSLKTEIPYNSELFSKMIEKYQNTIKNKLLKKENNSSLIDEVENDELFSKISTYTDLPY